MTAETAHLFGWHLRLHVQLFLEIKVEPIVVCHAALAGTDPAVLTSAIPRAKLNLMLQTLSNG
jgi:hypothetical protein